jgi:hypothetical protein
MEEGVKDQNEVVEKILVYNSKKQERKSKYKKESEPQPKTSFRDDKIPEEEDIKENELDLELSDLPELGFQTTKNAEDVSNAEG